MTLEIADALSFFRLSCGRWTSQRSQHHLLHRRAEAGASFIVVEELLKGDERLAEIAERGAAVDHHHFALIPRVASIPPWTTEPHTVQGGEPH